MSIRERRRLRVPEPARDAAPASAGHDRGQSIPDPATAEIAPGAHAFADLPVAPNMARVQRSPSAAEQERAPRPLDPAIAGEIDAARGGGAPLDAAARAALEPALGHDFSDVRIHADGSADRLNRALQANAFTRGPDIFFRSGAYNPAGSDGRALLAHELTHVVQQRGAPQGGAPVLDADDTPQERQADATARAVAGAGAPVAAGSAAPAGAVQRQPQRGAGGAPAATVSFEPEVIYNIGAGRTPADAISDALIAWTGYVRDFWNTYRDGLNNFETSMSFESDQSAESRYLDNALKAALKEAFSIALDAAATAAGIAPNVKIATAVISSVISEYERVEKAQGEVKIADYITTTRNAIAPKSNEMVKAIEDQHQPLLREYAKLQRDSESEAAATPGGTISGPGAAMVRDLVRAVQAFRAVQQRYTAPIFQQQITEKFAAMGAQRVGTVTGGNYQNARLYYECRVKNDGGKWSLDSGPDAWTLKTNAPNPDRVATSLRRALEGQGLKPYQASLEKEIRLTVQSGDWALFSDYDDGRINFTDIERIYVDNVEPRMHGRDPYMFHTAWEKVLKAKVMGITKVNGSGP